MSRDYPRIRDHDVWCNSAVQIQRKVRHPGKRKPTYLREPHPKLKCSLCKAQPVVAAITVQTSFMRGDDTRFYLCQECYDASGAKPLPRKASSAGSHGREEQLLAALRPLLRDAQSLLEAGGASGEGDA